MRRDQLQRFLNSDVVGQLTNGHFFEGHVVDDAGRTSVFDQDSQAPQRINPTRVKWLVRAVRYC
jgi:hypothetical protein